MRRPDVKREAGEWGVGNPPDSSSTRCALRPQPDFEDALSEADVDVDTDELSSRCAGASTAQQVGRDAMYAVGSGASDLLSVRLS